MTRTTALQLIGAVAVTVWLGVLTARVYRKPPTAPTPHGPLKLIGRTVNPIAGTGISLTPVDNTSTGQQDLTIASTVVGGVSSVSAGTGISVSPTTGAVVVTNTAPQTLPDPVTVPHGGTGDTTLTAHDLLVGNGTSAVNFLAPGLNGNLLCSNGTDIVSGCLPLLPSQGGTGVSSPTAHTVPIGEATSAFNFLSPSTSGFVLTSNGTGADPSFQKLGSARYANISSSTFTIGTSLTSCVTVGSVVVASGQNAYVTGMAWVASTDGATPHSVDLNITNVTNSGTGQVGQVDLGSTIATNGDANLSGMNIDNSVGTFTYAAQLLRTGALSTGTVQAHWCSIQAVVQ